MSVTEESRYQLFQRLDELLGPERVSTMMELLPPVGWADVATKRDLDHLYSKLDAKIDHGFGTLDAKIDHGLGALDAKIDHGLGALDAKIDRGFGALDAKIDHGLGALDAKMERLNVDLRAEMFREQRNQTLAIIGANTTVTALLLAAFQLL